MFLLVFVDVILLFRNSQKPSKNSKKGNALQQIKCKQSESEFLSMCRDKENVKRMSNKYVLNFNLR
jgi:hypothetical protein